MRLLSRTTPTVERPKYVPKNEPVEEKLHIYLRPGVAEDLVLFNSWFQNPITNRYSQMPKTWGDTMKWWKSLGRDAIISMVVLTDKHFPSSFYCGRTIGYIQLGSMDKDPVYLSMAIGDCSMLAMGIGSRMVEFAGEQILQLKKSGKFYSIIHPEDKPALSMAEKYRNLGVVQSISTMDNGWVRVNGVFTKDNIM